MGRLVAANDSPGMSGGGSVDQPLMQYDMRFVNFTESGTYTPGEDVIKYHVALVGAGAVIGFAANSSYIAYGGEVKRRYNITDKSPVTVTIGAAQAASSNSANGNPTYFGDMVALGGIYTTNNSPGTSPSSLWPDIGDDNARYGGAGTYIRNSSPTSADRILSTKNTAAGGNIAPVSGGSNGQGAMYAAPNSGGGAMGTGNSSSYASTGGSGFVQIIEIYSYVLPEPGRPLSDYTWPEIDIISRSGLASDYWQIGTPDAVKAISVNGVDYDAEIIGYNHDDLASGSGKAGISFSIKGVINSTNYMNSTNTSTGGWSSSYMRTNYMQTWWNQIDSDVKAVIKPVIKLTSAGGGSANIQTSTDSLWLLSIFELFGALYDTFSGEGQHYAQRFKNDSDRIKTLSGGTRTYWSRSPRSVGATSFGMVNGNGVYASAGASSAYFVCFGFCI